VRLTRWANDPPDWWRGRRPEPKRWSKDSLVLSGNVTVLNLQAAPLSDITILRSVVFDQANVQDVDVVLDELALTAAWSEFAGCTFRQRSRRLHREGSEPQGSFGWRPTIYRNCTFRGVRMRLRAGFSPGEARFEDCLFERCRFEEHFSFAADYVRCRFVGPMKTAVFFGSDLEGRRNDIEGNDFTEAVLSDNIGFRNDFPVDTQAWPPGIAPPRTVVNPQRRKAGSDQPTNGTSVRSENDQL
jgi:hypothetical protein